MCEKFIHAFSAFLVVSHVVRDVLVLMTTNNDYLQNYNNMNTPFLSDIVCDLSCENGGTPDVLGCTACHCPAGYSGTHCGDDIDECSTSETCSMNGVCTNSAGGFSCSCFAGYTGGRCQINIDECSEGTHDCLNGATCIDEAPGYRCSCREGTGGQKCENCVLSGCDTCATEKDPVLCTQCGLGYFLNNGYCGT